MTFIVRERSRERIRGSNRFFFSDQNHSSRYISTRSRIRSSCGSSHQQTIITSRRFCWRPRCQTTTTTTIVTMTRTTKEPTDVSHGGWCQKTCATKYVSRHSRFVWTNCRGFSRFQLVVSRHRRARRFHRAPSFGPFLLVLPLSSSSSLIALLLTPSCWLYTGFVISPGMRPIRVASGTTPMHLVSFSLDSSRSSFASHGNSSWEVTEKEVTLIGSPSSFDRKDSYSHRPHFLRNAKVQ